MTQFTLLKLCIWLFEKSGQKLGGLQQELLMEAIRGTQLKNITVSGFSRNYIGRVIAPRLWRQLSLLCGQTIRIRCLRIALIHKYEQLTPEERAEVEAIAPQIIRRDDIPIMPTASASWATPEVYPHPGAMPKSSKPFYSRATRLHPLKSSLSTKKTTLIFVNGRGGIGKTTLVSHVLGETEKKFQSIFWCDLSKNTEFEDNLSQISQALNLSGSGAIEDLCNHLTKRPCVLVFDHWELLFAEGELSGIYQPQHQAYAVLLEQIIRQPRAGVVIVITREVAPSMESAIATYPDRVKEICIPALPDACATRILEEYALGDRALWTEFIATYHGNPLKLRLLCAEIKEWYGGSIKIFRQQNTIIGGDTLREILQKFIHRTTELEREILHWLMLWQQPLTLPELQERYQDHVIFRSQVWDAVRSLERRFLIEKKAEATLPLLSLQPSIRRYLTQEFVMGCHREITQAIANGYAPEGFHLLNTYDLTVQTTNTNKTSTSMIGLIIKSLQQKIPNQDRLQGHLDQLKMALMAHISETNPEANAKYKYNLINLNALNCYLLQQMEDQH